MKISFFLLVNFLELTLENWGFSWKFRLNYLFSFVVSIFLSFLTAGHYWLYHNISCLLSVFNLTLSSIYRHLINLTAGHLVMLPRILFLFFVKRKHVFACYSVTSYRTIYVYFLYVVFCVVCKTTKEGRKSSLVRIDWNVPDRPLGLAYNVLSIIFTCDVYLHLMYCLLLYILWFFNQICLLYRLLDQANGRVSYTFVSIYCNSITGNPFLRFRKKNTLRKNSIYFAQLRHHQENTDLRLYKKQVYFT
jgi:hypothetical protein